MLSAALTSSFYAVQTSEPCIFFLDGQCGLFLNFIDYGKMPSPFFFHEKSGFLILILTAFSHQILASTLNNSALQ